MNAARINDSDASPGIATSMEGEVSGSHLSLKELLEVHVDLLWTDYSQGRLVIVNGKEEW